MGGKWGYSLQLTGRYSAINSKHLMATNQDTFVSAQESSKLHFTKCLFFAVRNTSPCQTDGGTYSLILPAKIAGGLMHMSCKRRGRSMECQPGEQSSRYNRRGTALGTRTQRKIDEMWRYCHAGHTRKTLKGNLCT